MKLRAQEIGAVAITLIVLVITPALIWAFGSTTRQGTAEGRVIVLTAVQSDGVWTDKPVSATGKSVKHYPAAAIEMRETETVTLRFYSGDVQHSFYVPELGIGPIKVKPGKMKQIIVENPPAGEYEYYCTTVCGTCHHFMRGTFSVLDKHGKHVAELRTPMGCGERMTKTGTVPAVAKGEQIFRERGCLACHGAGGAGGVVNPNYLKDTVPNLDALAERMMIFDEEAAQVAISLISSGADLKAAAADPPFGKYEVFLAQYKAIYEVIQNGNPAGKKHQELYEPPLQMPRWRELLSDEDIRNVIAYLIAQYPWDE